MSGMSVGRCRSCFNGAEMLLSIIVPVYNTEKYLKKCLDSILKQDFNDYEIILIDDGSKDNSGRICDEYSLRDARIRVVHKMNEGLLLARREGIKIAKGEYIMHCDADDYLAGNALGKIATLIEETNPDMLMFGYDVVNDNGDILENHYDVFDSYARFDEENKEDILFALANTTWINNIWSKVSRRDVVDIDSDYTPYKDIKMGEDVFQVIPLVDKSRSFVYIGEPLYKYRSNPDSMSKNYKLSYLDNHYKVSERLLCLLHDNDVSEKTIISFYDRYVHDIYKYLLRFLKQGISYEEYRTMYEEMRNQELYKDAKMYKTKMRKSNILFSILLHPSLYLLAKLSSKTVLSAKLK